MLFKIFSRKKYEKIYLTKIFCFTTLLLGRKMKFFDSLKRRSKSKKKRSIESFIREADQGLCIILIG